MDAFVSDSANGMSSIVTGVKTGDGVINQGPDAVRGKSDGVAIKTILKYAGDPGHRAGMLIAIDQRR